MLVLDDFKCSTCGLTVEEFHELGTDMTSCECGGLAYKTLGRVNFTLEPFSGDFPSATRAWENAHK